MILIFGFLNIYRRIFVGCSMHAWKTTFLLENTYVSMFTWLDTFSKEVRCPRTRFMINHEARGWTQGLTPECEEEVNIQREQEI